ncbi:MAG: protein translocase subunit SecD [bacterium]|jgi:preprotein translocase subunit SecD
MQDRIKNWVIIGVVLLLALAQPIYRNYKQLPILNLGLDLQGGADVLLQAQPTEGAVTDEQMVGAMEVIRNRVDPQGIKEINLNRVGDDRISLQVPGEDDPDKLNKLIGQTALLEFVLTGVESFENGTDLSEDIASGKYNVVLTGDDLKQADMAWNSGKPIIAFEFKKEAADTFGRISSENVGKHMAILLDKKVISNPVFRSAIWGGSGIIEGNFTVDDADLLARQLDAGRLPVPVVILQNRIVGPTLGRESLEASKIAGAFGFLVILIFMAILYRLPGLISDVTLLLYVVLVLGYLSLFDATLTLPGIAGFLLSIGMAIDANILIFERLKEELAWGKTLSAAVEAAFARAWVAIFDANLTTILAAVVLYIYGSGPIKGFAVTLTLGILISFFSAVFVTRFFLTQISVSVRNPKLYA